MFKDLRLPAAAALLSSAALAAELAWLHMRALGEVCGSSPHCGWCAAALASAASGLLVLAAPRLRPRRA